MITCPPSCELDPNEFKDLCASGRTDAEEAFHYTIDIAQKRCPDLEPVILKDPQWAFWYAAVILHRRWPEAEPIIARDPKWAAHYSLVVLQKSWPEAQVIFGHDHGITYAFYRSETYPNSSFAVFIRDENRPTIWAPQSGTS